MYEITVPATLENFDTVMALLENALQNVEAKHHCNINVAVEEIFVNIANYAYVDGAGDVSVAFSVDGKNFVARFSDEGIPFDPLTHAGPDLSVPIEEREIGGLGILMTKKMMDEITYKREKNFNILTLKKNL